MCVCVYVCVGVYEYIYTYDTIVGTPVKLI